MSALQPLNTLLEQATIERDAALGAHRKALSAVAAAQTQATQLAEYRQEYAQRFGTQFQRAGAIELLQCYQGFMVRLDEAVSQQQRLLALAVERGETAKAALLNTELRVASVRKLIERRIAEAVRTQDRSDQKATDELASRAAWLRLAGTAPGAALGAV